MYRPRKLLLACPWMNREDLECNVCLYRDPPQLELTGYMKWKFNWWAFSLDTRWQADECCAMGEAKCFDAACPYSTFPEGLLRVWPEFIR
jgi:hypothetical protein